jgi:AcrR family transcriptional regulator
MDKRELILEAALSLFVKFGFHGTPTSKIAQEAGVANGSLFHYFATKEILIVALYNEIKARMSAHVVENVKVDADIKETIKSQYLASLYWAIDNKEAFKYIEQFNSSPFLTLIPPDEIAKQLKLHYELLNKGIEAKIIKPLPADLIYTLIANQIYGLNQYMINNEFSKARQHQLINDTFELLWDMIT